MPPHFFAESGASLNISAPSDALNEARSGTVQTMSNVIELGGASPSNDGGESSENNSGADDSLVQAVEEVGGDIESAREYVDENGAKDKLVEFAHELAGNDELFEILEDYRAWNDQKRIVMNYLYNADAEFSGFLDAFWGDSDDPSPNTYNYVQQRSRDNGGNLAFYKALFPEPVAEYWDSEPVRWCERPDDDSDIFVSQEWLDTYAPYGDRLNIDGEEKVIPPCDSTLSEAAENGGSSGGDTSTGDAPFDPSEMTVDELRDALGESPEDHFTADELEALLDAEKAGEGKYGNRKTAKKAIRGSLNQLRDATDSDEQESDGGEKSAEAIAGEIVGEHGLDMNPEAIAGMIRGGMTKQEVIDRFA